jgi:hypothetical protein
MILLSGVSQGDTESTRDGNSIKCKGGLVDLLITTAVAATRTQVRCIIFADLHQAGTAPSLANVYATGALNGLLNIASFKNRFIVVHDSLTLVNNLSDNQAHMKVPLDAIIDLHFMFNGTGATVASCSGPTLFMILVSNEATNTPTVSYSSRLFFLDN